MGFLHSLPFNQGMCASLIELHFARIRWVSIQHWLCKEDDLQITDLWKGFDAQRRFIDGGVGFNKGRMLWLRLASAASYICKNKSTHNQTGMDAIQYHFYHSLEAHFSSVFLLVQLVVVELKHFCQISKQCNSQFTVHCRAGIGIPVITMVVRAGSVGWPGYSDFLQDEG